MGEVMVAWPGIVDSATVSMATARLSRQASQR